MSAPLPVDTEPLIAWVRANKQSSFYKDRWSEAVAFKDLPPVSRIDFFSTPLSLRRYKHEKALVKIVRTQEGLFASEWSFSDIAAESWGAIGMRPLIYLSDPDECLEKTIWCYEKNRLPLIAESLPEVVNSAADFYRIDSLITDSHSLPKLLPHLESRKKKLKHLSVVGSFFDIPLLRSYEHFAETVGLTLSLPETGAFGHAPLSARPVFSLLPGCYKEEDKGVVLLTKTATLVTPIIRYRLPDEVHADFF
jgi:hypothetical protein